MPRRLITKLESLFWAINPPRILDYYENTGQKPRGSVLVSYLSEPFKWRRDDRRFLGHSNCWESMEIVRILNRIGYKVDAIQWHDTDFIPGKEYAAIFDIHKNLIRYGGDDAVRIFHVTGSNPRFSNLAELERIADLKVRRNQVVTPRRSVSPEEVELFHRNLDAAGIITLLGNETTADTYPALFRHKMRFIPVTGSYLAELRDPWKTQFKREFLWYGGVGAVHKGLDLVLEIFSRHPDLLLHVIGPYRKEQDFMKIYRHELARCPNIISHGYMYPSSRKFRLLTEHVTAFILPSCSESTSTAAVTCMQYGLLPVVSVNCGVGLDREMGITLQNCSIDEIEQAVLTLCDTPEKDIRQMSAKAQEFALNTFSRDAFTRCMHDVLAGALS